ncbi:hypothetical protein FAES_pFAES01046 (plasmid) [Fibrella aestuarina BUZ 2]|uniref:Transmembrane protein n=1 Tax=Fibrella aestuarina BUZ 2 TaxID=1166018 RepID=I0KHD7_9BACT|nr:hypothetical protein [Fibrella aestuarina]CCH03540.1 hypothetical protein FAES_pFAES01046 [Fibrella aestuarina BUZ 2]
MLLAISTSTFLVVATVALLVWAGGVLYFTGRAKAKKTTRPTPTLQSFFQPTAGKVAVDVPMPMASYRRSELISLAKPGRNPAIGEQAVPVSTEAASNATTPPSSPAEPELDDPTFAPADEEQQPPIAVYDNQTTTPVTEPVASPGTFKLSVNRQLLSRLLSDDSLCEEFEAVRASTLEQQRETGRTYGALFREALADKPADVQAVLLNLLTEEEEEDFDRALPT